MPRIRLYVLQSLRTAPGEVIDDQGQLIQVPFLRACSYLHIGARTRYFQDCIVDTGAPVSVFPRSQWTQFANDVEWLRPTDPQPSWLTRLRGRTGGCSPCRVGRIAVAAFDMEQPRQRLAPVSVIAQFEERYQPNDRIIIGLHGSILQRRRLIVDPDLREAWLEDR
jgi:hypothetical protein